MIDWDYERIDDMQKHYDEVFDPQVDFHYFTRNFEEIYRMSLYDGVLLPDILNDVTYYTTNGVNAKDKILFPPTFNDSLLKRISEDLKTQRDRRMNALGRGITTLYRFQVKEVVDFVKRYPQWSDLIKK